MSSGFPAVMENTTIYHLAYYWAALFILVFVVAVGMGLSGLGLGCARFVSFQL